MQAVALFRGHEFPAPLMRRTVGGPLVEVQRQSYGPSRITMRAAHLKKASIVFILDCSHSMADAVPVEEPSVSSAGAMMPKIRIAVDAMQSMMERLGDQGDVRVGVRFFGHRVGWRTDQNGVIARQENYPGGVPATLAALRGRGVVPAAGPFRFGHSGNRQPPAEDAETVGRKPDLSLAHGGAEGFRRRGRAGRAASGRDHRRHELPIQSAAGNGAVAQGRGRRPTPTTASAIDIVGFRHTGRGAFDGRQRFHAVGANHAGQLHAGDQRLGPRFTAWTSSWSRANSACSTTPAASWARPIWAARWPSVPTECCRSPARSTSSNFGRGPCSAAASGCNWASAATAARLSLCPTRRKARFSPPCSPPNRRVLPAIVSGCTAPAAKARA